MKTSIMIFEDCSDQISLEFSKIQGAGNLQPRILNVL